MLYAYMHRQTLCSISSFTISLCINSANGQDGTHEGLQNMILKDQFFITCDKPLQIFLKERGKLNPTEMTQAVDNYVEAHGQQVNRSEAKQNNGISLIQ